MNKSKWTKVFRDFADTVGVSVEYDPKTREYSIVDDQGTISFDETFKNPTETVERLYGLAERYILEDLEDEAESYGITDFAEFPSNLNSMSDWYGLYADLDVDYDNPEFVASMKDFIADHKSEFDWIDLFSNHCDAVDLKNLYK